MRTKLIAEVASNHGGDLALAKEFIRAAAESGADFVKFQSWQSARMRPDDAQYDWFRRSELSDDAHLELIGECRERQIGFLTTCFDLARVDYLASLGMSTIKVGSADTTSYRMLAALRPRFSHVILSTGMATDDEVRRAVSVLASGSFTLMHTVSLYPTPIDCVGLRRMRWLSSFTESVGYSDHTIGLEAAEVAIAMGARYVEKHLCLGKNGPGRVMAWDMTPTELAELARFADQVETLAGTEDLPMTAELVAARERFIGRFGDDR
jgi:sialic acid synthase SpsE